MKTQRIALVSIPDRTRDMLETYLTSSGFDVHVCEDLGIGSAFPALVLLAHDMPADDVRTRVRAWMKAPKIQVIVVVTSRPAVLGDLYAGTGTRLVVFASPVFGWDVVDAVRATEPLRPRGA